MPGLAVQFLALLVVGNVGRPTSLYQRDSSLQISNESPRNFGPDLHATLGTSCNNLDDFLTFHFAAPSGQKFSSTNYLVYD